MSNRIAQSNKIQQLIANSQPLKLAIADQDQVINYFQAAWQLYEWIFSSLDPCSKQLQNIQPNPFRNSLAFYYGHTAAFYVKKLRLASLIDKPIAQWDDAMATGVWPKAASDISASQAWPPFSELRYYREQVYSTVLTVIEQQNFDRQITEKDSLWSLLMGIEHEFIHFQTIIPLIRQVPLDLLSPPSEWPLISDFTSKQTASISDDEWLAFTGGEVTIGRVPGENYFYGWDNEYGNIIASVAPFKVKKYPVTNQEYLQFVEAGGYQNPTYWTSSEADVWFQTLSPTHPASWLKQKDGLYRYRALFEVIEMPWQWPVEVNKHEAVAYANWANARLINEAEFHYLLNEEFPDTDTASREFIDFNVNLRHYSPLPVGKTLPESSKTKVDLFGNVARWMDNSFQALCKKQFFSHSYYPDFSEPWFRGDHSLILGAGYASLGHMGHIGLMRDFMQNHMDQVAGITLIITD